MLKPGVDLRGRLLVFALALAVPLLELSGVVAWYAYRGERLRVEERLRDLARAAAGLADAEAVRVRSVLQVLAGSSALAQGGPDALRPEMERVSAALQGAAICAVGPEGRFAVADSGTGCGIGPLRVSLAAPARGGTAYVLSATLPDAALAAAFARQPLPPGWTVTVAERDGGGAVRWSAGARSGAPAVTTVPAAVLAAAAERSEGVLRGVVVQGGPPSAIAFVRAPGANTLVLVAAAEAEVAAPLRGMLLRLGLTGAALLAPAVVGGGLLARRIVGFARDLAARAGALDRRRRPRAVTEPPEAAAVPAFIAQGAGRELADAEARFRAVFEGMPDALALVRVELETGRLVYEAFNHAAERLTGLRAAEAVGRQADEFMPPELAAPVLGHQRECVARRAPLRCQGALAFPAGTRVVEEHLVPLQDPATGRVVRMVCRTRDATGQRDSQTRSTQEKAQALGQLAGGIAHEMNNVLQALSGGVLLVQSRAADPATVRRLTGTLLKAVERGAAVTRRLLAYARRDELRPEAISPAALLDELREVLAHTLGTGVQLQVEAGVELPCFSADRRGLEAALIDLAANARDAMPAGGTLRLWAQAELLAAGMGHPHGPPPGAYIRLALADTGVGMSAAVLARAADPFFTTKPPGEGAGLGLSMARGFAEQSGGGLALASTPGQGTTVTLWLPQAGASDEGTEFTAPSARRVLLVDDDPLVRGVLSEELADHGFAVVAMGDGPAALAWLDGQVPELLVSDLSMPGMDGLALIRAAQSRRPGLPAILLTGYATDGARAVGDASNGTFSLLRKPVSGSQLANRVAAVLGKGERDGPVGPGTAPDRSRAPPGCHGHERPGCPSAGAPGTT